MIDRYILPLQHRILAPVAGILARHIGADMVTLAGFAAGVACVAAIWAGMFGLALALLVLNRLADGLDGEIARLRGPTDRGAFLDITLDFFFYALFPLGFALHDPMGNGFAAALLIASFIGTGASFLAFAAITAKRGQSVQDYPGKGIPYLGGLTEGAETIAVFIAMLFWPDAFVPLAGVFSAACMLTAFSRVVAGWRAFG